jgi:hypothetical protein
MVKQRSALSIHGRLLIYMNSGYGNSDDKLLSPLTIQALQKCVRNKNTEGFKRVCQSEISKFHLYAKDKTSDWNRLIKYVEENFSGIYPHLVTDALVDFLTQNEFQRQSSNGSTTLPYPLSNGANFLLKRENIESKVAQAIENSKLDDEISSDFVAALNECVSIKNLQAFGMLVRSEFVFSHLYQKGKEKELGHLLEYLRSNFPDIYFDASIQALTEFLLQQQFFKEATHGEMETSLNSICKSLAIAGGLENKAKAMVEIANQLGTHQQPQKNKELQFEEVPSQRKIIEKRKFLGKLKVFASWYLIWNTIHQIVWDLIFAIVLCNILIVCTNSNLPVLRASRILLATCTSIVHINMRMNSKAKKRWKLKYGDVNYNKKNL